MDAVDFKATAESQNPRIPTMGWKTSVVCAGPWADLRRIFPYMIVAAKDYIGTNTGKRIEFLMQQEDERVVTLTGKK
jgi:hypothetical protein